MTAWIASDTGRVSDCFGPVFDLVGVDEVFEEPALYHLTPRFPGGSFVLGRRPGF